MTRELPWRGFANVDQQDPKSSAVTVWLVAVTGRVADNVNGVQMTVASDSFDALTHRQIVLPATAGTSDDDPRSALAVANLFVSGALSVGSFPELPPPVAPETADLTERTALVAATFLSRAWVFWLRTIRKARAPERAIPEEVWELVDVERRPFAGREMPS